MNGTQPITFAARRALLIVALVATAIAAAVPARATTGAQAQAPLPPTVGLAFPTTPIRWGEETTLTLSYTNPETTAVDSVTWSLIWNDAYVQYLGTTLSKPSDTQAGGGKSVVFTNVLPGETRTATTRLRVKSNAPTRVPVTGSVALRTGPAEGTFLLNEAVLQVSARQVMYIPVAEVAPAPPRSTVELSLEPARAKAGTLVRLYIRATNPVGAPVTSIAMALDDWDFRYLQYDGIVVPTPLDRYEPFGALIEFDNVRPGETRTAYMRLTAKAPPANISVRFGGTYTEGTATGSVSGNLNEVTLEIER